MRQSSEKNVEADAKERIEDLEKQLDILSREFREYKQKQVEEESRRLKTALLWAGAIIIGLGGFMWSEIIWPVLKAGRP